MWKCQINTLRTGILKHLSRKAYYSKNPCDLDLWHSHLKINRGHLLVITSINTKYEDYMQLSGKAFFNQGLCDPDLSSSDFKINRGHLLIMTNLRAKYEDCGSKESLVIGKTSFFKSKPLWPEPLTWWPQNKKRSFTNSDWPPCQIWRLWVKGILSYLADKLFIVKVPVTITFEPVISKSIGVNT
jgi:hypothetical protein